MGFLINCTFMVLPVGVHSSWIYVHTLLDYVRTLGGPLAFHDPVPQNADLN